MKEHATRQWYPRARADRRPSHWWYWGRALYVSRRDYWAIFLRFLVVGLPLGAAGVLLDLPLVLAMAFVLAGVGIVLLVYSMFGLYRMYGHPSMTYYRRLLDQGAVRDGMVVADLHIGTYRTAFALADLLPGSVIHTIDCWDVEGPPAEAAVGDVRYLEPAPTANARIRPAKAVAFAIPLPDASCEAVVFGFGTHEIPAGGARERLLDEATRILRPGGSALIFEHGKDAHNFVIFGPVIGHVTRREEWLQIWRERFVDVTYARSSAAVDIIAGRRRSQ